MANVKMQPLAAGYRAEVDTVDQTAWHNVLDRFADANIYQTWAFAETMSGRSNTSHLVVKDGDQVVGAVQVRLARMPVVGAGIAYVRWGPLYRSAAGADRVESFRQSVRALRNEYAVKRGLVLRLFPMLFVEGAPELAQILVEEGFSGAGEESRSRTILMDVNHTPEALRAGMRSHWRRELKIAEKKGLEVVEGTSDELFAAVIDIHREMVLRKRFVEGNDITLFRAMQAQLPERFKMNVMICRSEAGVCAGHIASAMGDTSLYLFGATSNIGMRSNGGYLLHWQYLQRLKDQGRTTYDLNGINPATNPGTYKFKAELAGEDGRDVTFLGRFETHVSALSYECVRSAEMLRAFYRNWKRVPDGARRGEPTAVEAR